MENLELNKNRSQCPCCDYYTLIERGQYDICPICFWEDDGINLDQLDNYSDPNHLTLREGRQNFEKFGACDSAMVKNVIPESQRRNSNLKKEK